MIILKGKIAFNLIILLPPNFCNTYIFKKIFKDKNIHSNYEKQEEFEYDPRHLI